MRSARSSAMQQRRVDWAAAWSLEQQAMAEKLEQLGSSPWRRSLGDSHGESSILTDDDSPPGPGPKLLQHGSNRSRAPQPRRRGCRGQESSLSAPEGDDGSRMLLDNPTVAALSALLARSASLSAAAALHARLLRSSRLFSHPFLANCLAAAYSRLGATPAAIALLTHAPSDAANRFSHNILLAALLKSRDLPAARRLFDEMPMRDTVAYNSMISGYAQSGHAGEALSLARRMRGLGVRPSAFTFSIVSSAVCSAPHGMQVHAAAVRHGSAQHNAVVGNTLVDMYRRVGLLEYAVRVFWNMNELDIVSLNSVMSVYKDDGQSNAVFECFRLTRSHGLSVDECSVSTVLTACTDIEDFAKGDQLLALCVKTGLLSNSIICSAVIGLLSMSDRLPDVVRLFEGLTKWDSETCNAMISCYARSGLMEQALGLFVIALRNAVLPTEFTFASVLRWSSCFGLMEQGTQIHTLVYKCGFEDDMIVATALVDMYCKLGSLKHARKLFDSVCVKDLVLWNTMIIGLSRNGGGREALGVFWWMLDCGVKPDRITLFGALSACSLGGLVNEAMDIIFLFKAKYHVVPGLEHYACVADMLSRAGLFREAEDLVQNKLQKCNTAALLNILEACMIQGDFAMAESIAENMLKLKPRSSLPYTVLARTYGARCKWESMARMWRSMEALGAKKVGECSWLCIKNEIHVFTSEQILHQGSEVTYAVLDLLFWDMMDHIYAPGRVGTIHTQDLKKNKGFDCHPQFLDCTLLINSLHIFLLQILCAGVVVAAKFTDDAFFKSAFYARVGGIGAFEMNQLELDFLFNLDFWLKVNLETFGNCCLQLEKHAPRCGSTETAGSGSSCQWNK
ncbi:pentatricopeptide repeat-containing protein [Hordeum vulgare]|nr:pentatricopeptide repeat-containing protein [Hordeum vulgare]